MTSKRTAAKETKSKRNKQIDSKNFESKSDYLQRPEVIESHLGYAGFSRIASKKVMYFMNIIIHQLMCKPRARLYILHLGPVLLTHVLILVNTRPTRKIVIRRIHK